MSKKDRSKRAKKSRILSLPVWIWVIIGVLFVTGVVAIVFQTNRPPATTSLPVQVSVVEAAQLRQSGAFILDVREPEEWNEVHIPGATLIPLGELSSRVNEIPADKQIVVVCRSGNRSQQGRDILLDAGFTQVTSMAGGVNQWRDTGYPTTTGP